MKYLVIACIAFCASTSFAITVKNCPQQVAVELYDIEAYGDSLVSKLDVLNLTSTSGSTCSYSGEDQQISGRIEGSLRPNAKQPAQIVLYFNSGFAPNESKKASYIAYVNILGINDRGTFDFSTKAKIYAWGEDCYYGCVPNYSYVGEAKFNFLEE